MKVFFKKIIMQCKSTVVINQLETFTFKHIFIQQTLSHLNEFYNMCAY